MSLEIRSQATPEIATIDHLLKQYLAKISKIACNTIQHASILKRLVYVRQKAIKIILKVNIYLQEEQLVK